MFVDCILIWHDATGHWPPLTKGKGSDGDGGADSPVYKAIFNCLHENGAAKAQGIGDDTFLDAVRIAKSDNGVPSGLLSGRDAARAAIKDKRRNKQAKVKQRP